jgi:AraC-like DNA-binding protein
MNAELTYQPHLLINEMRISPGAEWSPRFRHWAFILVQRGVSYWQQPSEMRELSAGEVLVLAGDVRGELRASQLNEVELAYFCVDPGLLTGLLSLREQQFLNQFAATRPSSARLLSPADPNSQRFKALCLDSNRPTLSTRVQLLQVFADLLKLEPDHEPEVPTRELDGRGRLRNFLERTALSEFLKVSLSDLAPKVGCSPRHLSRLFHEEAGVSFQKKQTELRLAKACELLSRSNAKVADVAAASGYLSHSQFSLLFHKHFGVSPGRWREQQHVRKKSSQPRLSRLSPLCS